MSLQELQENQAERFKDHASMDFNTELSRVRRAVRRSVDMLHKGEERVKVIAELEDAIQ